MDNPGNRTRKIWKKVKSRVIPFRSSIYGRVVLVIMLLSIFLFASFSLIFKSVNDAYLNTVLQQSGNNIATIVNGALYHAMLENDKGSLQNTLDIINGLPEIDEVNMYDRDDQLVYSSIPSDTNNSHSDPNCSGCHRNLAALFPGSGTSYRIIDVKNDCRMVHNDNEGRHLLIRSPILNDPSCYNGSCHAHKPEDTRLGSLIIKIPLATLDESTDRATLEFFLLATFITLALMCILIIFTMKRIKNPLNDLVQVSMAVANGDTSKRAKIQLGQLDDMRAVARAFNDMLDNLQSAADELQNWSQQLEYKVRKKTEELGDAQNELMHIERLASLGKLSSSVAHEINNPLSGILIYTKLLHKQISNPENLATRRESMLRHLRLIESETKRCGDIVKGLLDFSRKGQDDFEPASLHMILKETYDLMTHPMKIAGIQFITDFSATEDLVYCNPNQVKQACMALLVNASEAVSENGEVTIRTRNADPETITLDIADNGVGISPEILPHIFEPFFSTKQGASGIGLGLSIVHGIIQNHGGKIQVRSESGKGTVISVILPRSKS